MRPPRPYLFFACTAIILAILRNGNVVSQDVQPDPKDAVDFILLIDLVVPHIAGYSPRADSILRHGSDKIYKWTMRLLMVVMEQSYFKSIDTRVIVFLRDKGDSLKKEAEYYSRHHYPSPSKPYNLPGLMDKKAKMDAPITETQLRQLREKLSSACAADRPSNRTGVPEIVVWHVPYDGNKTWDVNFWRMAHYPPADVMVTMEEYWNAPPRTHHPMIISRVQKEAYRISWEVPLDMNPQSIYRVASSQDQVIGDLWKIFEACRGKVKSLPCHFDETGACVIKNLYTPSEKVERNLRKFCRNGTQVLDCPNGREQCELVCADGSKEGPCSATCGEGEKVKRPKDPNDALTKYCNWNPQPCYGPPCDQPLETTKRETAETRLTHSVSSTTSTAPATAAVDGIVLESWMIAVIAVGATAVLATIICIIALCLCQRKRKRALMNQQRAPAHHRYGQTGRSHTRTGHGGWSRRAPSPSHPRNVQPPSHPRTKSPSHPRTKSPSHPRTKSPSHQRTKSPSPSSPNLPAHSHIRREGAVGTVSASFLTME